MIGPHVLDGMSLSVEHATEGMLGGADGRQGVPVVTGIALLNEVGSQADCIVAHVIASIDPCSQVLQVAERRNGHGLCRCGGLADESKGVTPSHQTVVFRVPVLLCTGTRHIERALTGELCCSVGSTLVIEQVVVSPGGCVAGSASHLLQFRQVHKGSAAYAVQGRGQSNLLQ